MTCVLHTARISIACEQALYSGGQRELFSLRAPKARGEPLGERSELAVKNENSQFSPRARFARPAARFARRNSRLRRSRRK